MTDKKRMTSAQRLDKMESTVEEIQGSISRIDTLSARIFAQLETMNQQNTPAQVAVHSPMFYEHSGMAGSQIKATNIEKPVQTKGCFEILEALMKQYPNEVSVSAPHVKKDGTLGKSYILNLPRIDENFVLVNKDGTSKTQQVKEAKELWKAVAFNGYTFTGKYFKSGEGSVFTTYIKQANEVPFLKWLSDRGVHIPQKDAHAPDKEDIEE